jgi:hypothetical protein
MHYSLAYSLPIHCRTLFTVLSLFQENSHPNIHCERESPNIESAYKAIGQNDDSLATKNKKCVGGAMVNIIAFQAADRSSTAGRRIFSSFLFTISPNS